MKTKLISALTGVAEDWIENQEETLKIEVGRVWNRESQVEFIEKGLDLPTRDNAKAYVEGMFKDRESQVELLFYLKEVCELTPSLEEVKAALPEFISGWDYEGGKNVLRIKEFADNLVENWIENVSECNQKEITKIEAIEWVLDLLGCTDETYNKWESFCIGEGEEEGERISYREFDRELTNYLLQMQIEEKGGEDA